MALIPGHMSVVRFSEISFEVNLKLLNDLWCFNLRGGLGAYFT